MRQRVGLGYAADKLRLSCVDMLDNTIEVVSFAFYSHKSTSTKHRTHIGGSELVISSASDARFCCEQA